MGSLASAKSPAAPSPATEELVSVVTPCYNSQHFLGETVRSVAGQDYPRIEHLIVDDGSADHSWKVVESFGAKVKGIRLRHRGGCHARNAGARAASGGFLLFLDADDTLAPDTVSALVRTIKDQKDSLAACTWKRLRWDRESWAKVSSNLPLLPPSGDYIRDWLTGWYLPPCSILWPRRVFEKTGGWDEELTANQDGDLMLRALLSGIRIVMAEGGEAYYREHGLSRLSVSSDVASRGKLRSRVRVLEKVAAIVETQGGLGAYRVALGAAYHSLARNNFDVDEELARLCEERAGTLGVPSPLKGSVAHRVLCKLLGLERKERLARKLAGLGISRKMRRKRQALAKLKGHTS